MSRTNLTALHDQAEAECRDELARLVKVYRQLATIHGDAQAIAGLSAMLHQRPSCDLAMCLAFAVRESARGARIGGGA